MFPHLKWLFVTIKLTCLFYYFRPNVISSLFYSLCLIFYGFSFMVFPFNLDKMSYLLLDINEDEYAFRTIKAMLQSVSLIG